MGGERDRHEPDPELGGYSTADMDEAFLRSQRSDLPSIAVRVLTLAVVYAVMARAIKVHDLHAGYLLVPLAFEWLLAQWFGWVLARFVVDCPRFRKAGGRIGVPLGWTIAISLITVAVLKWGDGGFSEPLGSAWSEALATLLASGLIWALVAEVVGLLAGTIPEIHRWRRVGGTFVWTTVTNLGLRFAMILLLWFVGIFAMILAAGPIGEWIAEDTRRIAWLVFGILLVIDIGALVLGSYIHRDVAREAAKGR